MNHVKTLQVRPVSKELLLSEGGIWFRDVRHGFEAFKGRIVEGTAEELRKYLQGLKETNGEEHTFMDFYYSRLEEGERERVLSCLSEEHRAFLLSRRWNPEEVYYAYHPVLFQIGFDLSVKENLFSTFYFTGFPCTVWGNYGRKFIEFTS